MNGMEPLKWKRRLQNHQHLHQFFVQYLNDKTLWYLKAWSNYVVLDLNSTSMDFQRDVFSPTWCFLVAPGHFWVVPGNVLIDFSITTKTNLRSFDTAREQEYIVGCTCWYYSTCSRHEYYYNSTLIPVLVLRCCCCQMRPFQKMHWKSIKNRRLHSHCHYNLLQLLWQVSPWRILAQRVPQKVHTTNRNSAPTLLREESLVLEASVPQWDYMPYTAMPTLLANNLALTVTF